MPNSGIPRPPVSPRHRLSLALATLALLLTISGSGATAAVVAIQDTGSPLGERLDAPAPSTWKAIPTDLLSLEKDPPKASSDPGYYGRDYHFGGDAVVENSHLTAVFSTARGRVLLFPHDTPVTGQPVAECVAIPAAGTPGPIRLELLRNAADEVILGLAPAAAPADQAPSVIYVFDRSPIVEVRTAEPVRSLRLQSPVEYGVVPGFIGDDLVLPARTTEAAATLHLPSEHAFVGLLTGGDRELVVTWPDAQQKVRLQSGPAGSTSFAALEIEPAGRSVYLAPLAAPGLWHRQPLVATNLEADVAMSWKRPFPARWKTQLQEGDARTTFTFHESRGQIWRGVPGSYSYPVWFEGDTAWIHPSKKVPPKGEAVIYFLEGQNTPASVTTPVEIIRATLGRTQADEVLDATGRRLRTHHRRGGDGVRRACTCGCTEAIQEVFESGQEVDRRDYIRSALDDMIYFVARHVERIGEYQRFADELLRRLDAAAAGSPELKTYVDGLKETAALIPQECTLQKENMKSPQHADDLAKRTLALTSRKDPTNVKAYMELLKAWRDMGGAQDYVVAQCHVVARRLHQEAGYAAVSDPRAAALAKEIRKACRQVLRNPDGYEIWAEY